MTESKPWYQSLTLWSAIVSLVGLLLGRFADGAPLFDEEASAMIAEILTYFGIGGVALGRVRADKTIRAPVDGRRGYASLSVALMAALLGALAMACTTTYAGKTSAVNVSALGNAGMAVKLDVDGQEVCRVNGERSTLRVDKLTAKRICAAHAGAGCTWR